LSETVAIIAKVKTKAWSYEINESVYYLEPLSQPSPNQMKHCVKHGKVIFFSASLEECPACQQIGEIKFADV
jgi:hypothetical protein